MSATPEILLELRNITKEFPGVLALDHVTLDVRKGEVLALVGENGAGKSTLIKLVTGALSGWTGEMLFEGKPLRISHPYEAQRLGIAAIYQELTLCGNISVAENIFLGREPRTRLGTIDWKKLNDDAAVVLNSLGVKVSPKEKVDMLSVATQQLIEICRALTMDAKLIIMDEPTSSLSKHEINILYGIVKQLQERGISIIFISHKFDEIFTLSDRISVLRDGVLIGTLETRQTQWDDVISMMVGRKLHSMWPKRNYERQDCIFRVRNLSGGNKFHNVEWNLYQGEILGVYGLVGAGRSEMARAICGIDKADSGEIFINGAWRPLPASASKAFELGIAMLMENRKEEGLLVQMTVAENTVMSKLVNRQEPFFIHTKAERENVDAFIQKLSIKTPSRAQVANNLSGGNQQKVAIAKLLNTHSRILIFDEPTRGIDVGAKTEIYQLINALSEEGYSIVMISSELPEIVGLCDRVVVMHEGEVKQVLEKHEISQEKIVTYATA